MLRVIAGIIVVSVVAACNAASPPQPVAPEPAPGYPVGIRQVEFVDRYAEEGERHLALNIFYPADSAAGARFEMPFYTGLDLIVDAPPAADDQRRPLIVFSHGRGSNGLVYAWFAQALASRGYVVAALDHYHANTYDSSIEYLANKLWRRPLDLTLTLDFLLSEPFWSSRIDPERIGVAGHSQGGFTALWIGGARVNAEAFLAFQQGWKDNRMVPAHLRAQLPLDPEPALNVADSRIRAVFAMAPGIIQAFGMDAAGLADLRVPTYLTVGAADTQTPPEENAVFASRHIPGAELVVIAGDVDHEIFVNECTEIGRDEFPEACVDAPGVDRAAVHRSVGDAAVRFFGAHLGG